MWVRKRTGELAWEVIPGLHSCYSESLISWGPPTVLQPREYIDLLKLLIEHTVKLEILWSQAIYTFKDGNKIF